MLVDLVDQETFEVVSHFLCKGDFDRAFIEVGHSSN